MGVQLLAHEWEMVIPRRVFLIGVDLQCAQKRRKEAISRHLAASFS